MLPELDPDSFPDTPEDDNDDSFRSNSSTDEVKPGHMTTATATVILAVLFIEGFVGTVWIILSIVRRRSTWSIANVFVASLCINDTLSLLLFLLIIDSYAWRRWRAGPLLCRLNPQLTVALTGCSLWHSALIAVHRYIVVVHRKHYNRMGKNAYVIFVLVTTRLVPFACAFAGISPRSSGHVPKLLRCILLPGRPMRMLAVTLVQIVAPSVVVVVCYSVVFLFVLTADRKLSGPRTVSARREIRITKMFGLIFLTILGGFVPYAVVRNLDSDNSLNGDVYVVISVFYAIATCSNPIVYGAMSRDIRCACAVLLRDAALCVCGRERGCVAAIEKFLLSAGGSSTREPEGGQGVDGGRMMMRGGTTANNATYGVSSQSHPTQRDETPAASAAVVGRDGADDAEMMDVRRDLERKEVDGEEGELGRGKIEREATKTSVTYEEADIVSSVSGTDDGSLHGDDDKMVHNDDDKVVLKTDDKMALKDDDKMVSKDDDKMVHRQAGLLENEDVTTQIGKNDDVKEQEEEKEPTEKDVTGTSHKRESDKRKSDKEHSNEEHSDIGHSDKEHSDKEQSDTEHHSVKEHSEKANSVSGNSDK